MVDFKKLLANQRARQELPDDPLESEIESKVGEYAKARGFWHRKFKSANQRSVPDRVFHYLSKAGGKLCFYIEFKRRGKTFTEAQELVVGDMREAGATVYLIDSIESGEALIDNLLDVLEWAS